MQRFNGIAVGCNIKSGTVSAKSGNPPVVFYAGGMRSNNPANSISAVCGNISTGWMQ